MRTLELELENIDREQAFLLFAAFCGDVERTAVAIGINPAAVLKMAEDGGWLAKLHSIIELRKSTRPGDLERAISRAINFVQAHRFRLFVERVIKRLTDMNAEEFEKYLLTGSTPKGESIPKLSTRALADLASALEKAQAMTYLALGDTAAERVKRNEVAEGSAHSAGELHVRIAEGLAKVRASQTPRAVLFDAQLQQAAEVVPKTKTPPPVVDDEFREED